uniref:NADH:flavin oxidoreductase/NADH oxidase N-terminal domain-containing protein n=1 Tax=Parascaris univalens TaxID=6257 RepID=A0A915BPB3_PARUN
MILPIHEENGASSRLSHLTFISLATNKRTDKCGGSLENRARIPLEIYEAIRQEVTKNFIVGIKVNSAGFQKEALQAEDAARTCKLLDETGFDFMLLSGRTMVLPAFSHTRESASVREAFFLDCADEIMQRVMKSVIYVVVGFRTAQAMGCAVETVPLVVWDLEKPITQEQDLLEKSSLVYGQVARRTFKTSMIAPVQIWPVICK